MLNDDFSRIIIKHPPGSGSPYLLTCDFTLVLLIVGVGYENLFGVNFEAECK